MKKTLMMVLLLCPAALAFAQGSVHFSNSTLSRISLITPMVPPYDIPLTPNINFGLFYGIGQSTSLTFLSSWIGVNSTSTAGIIVNPADRKTVMTTVALPGTSPGETDVWLQVKAWDTAFGTDWVEASLSGQWFGESQTRNVGALGPPTGPGVWIWQPATGTSPILIPAFVIGIPEPSMLALAGLGTAALFVFRRRTAGRSLSRRADHGQQRTLPDLVG